MINCSIKSTFTELQLASFPCFYSSSLCADTLSADRERERERPPCVEYSRSLAASITLRSRGPESLNCLEGMVSFFFSILFASSLFIFEDSSSSSFEQVIDHCC